MNLEGVIEPIVRGQIRSWLHAHPEAPTEQMITGISKRVTNELCAPDVVRRIELALSQVRGNLGDE